MCDEYGEICFSQKMFTNGLNLGLSLRVKKTVHGVGTSWNTGKEKVSKAVVSKEGHADSVLGHDNTCHYWFEKWETVNNASYQQPLRQCSPYLLLPRQIGL